MKLRLKRGLTFFCLPALFLIEGTGFLSGRLDVVVGVPVPDDFRGYAVRGVFKPRLFQFTLPDDDDIPALGFQLAPDLLVSLLVSSHLSRPKLSIGLGDSVVLAVLVAVPKAAVDEDDSAVLGKDDIRSSWQPFIVNSIPKTITPEDMTQLKFRAGVLGSVMRHTFETLLWCHWDMDYNTNLRRFN